MAPLSPRDRLTIALVRIACLILYARQVVNFRQRLGVWPDPATPATVADKFLWRKIFDRNPMLVLACDKLASKDFALSVCPELKVPETLWSGTDPDELPLQLLAGNVVIKANHGCRWNILVTDGKVDVDDMRRKTRRWARRTFGGHLGEWAYSRVRKRILVEAMLMEDGQAIAKEYKFHVAGGRTVYVFVSFGRFSSDRQMFTFDRDGIAYSLDRTKQFAGVTHAPPRNFLRLRELAERLGRQFDYVRCDFYERGDELYFSEFTVYPSSGMANLKHPELAERQNRGWDLRNSWFLASRQRGWRHAYAMALTRWLEQQDAAAQDGAGAAHDRPITGREDDPSGLVAATPDRRQGAASGAG